MLFRPAFTVCLRLALVLFRLSVSLSLPSIVTIDLRGLFWEVPFSEEARVEIVEWRSPSEGTVSSGWGWNDSFDKACGTGSGSGLGWNSGQSAKLKPSNWSSS